jgi:hypothetical protein
MVRGEVHTICGGALWAPVTNEIAFESTTGLVWLPPSLKRVTAFLIRMTPPAHAHFMTLKATPEGPRSVFFY